MCGIPREVIEHHLKIYPDDRLVQQKPQKQSVERQNFIHEELMKLLDAGFIREVHHLWCLANLVVVPKAGRKLQMCIDYTSLKKACPKDPFPLARIDQIIDSTSGCDLLCFLYAYAGFHQIPMSREDKEHIAFITVDDLFCYVSMPYGLKNALPTFVHAMHKTFEDLIRDLVDVYVDDIIVKIKSHSSLLDNLALAIVFDRLRSMRMMLNPDKCVFRVSTGKLLGFLVRTRESRLTQRRSRQSKRCGHQPASRMSRSSRDAWPHSADLSLDWLCGLSHSSSYCGSPDPLSGPRRQMRHSRR
jgi:predicted metal-binding protein